MFHKITTMWFIVHTLNKTMIWSLIKTRSNRIEHLLSSNHFSADLDLKILQDNPLINKCSKVTLILKQCTIIKLLLQKIKLSRKQQPQLAIYLGQLITSITKINRCLYKTNINRALNLNFLLNHHLSNHRMKLVS